MTQYNSMNLHN